MPALRRGSVLSDSSERGIQRLSARVEHERLESYAARCFSRRQRAHVVRERDRLGSSILVGSVRSAALRRLPARSAYTRRVQRDVRRDTSVGYRQAAASTPGPRPMIPAGKVYMIRTLANNCGICSKTNAIPGWTPTVFRAEAERESRRNHTLTGGHQ
jgi:hypothetical protein